jgi:hypothetical protein
VKEFDMTRKRVYISMTSVLKDVVRGQVALDDLRDSNNLFVFGCLASHVLDPGAPFELTWADDRVESSFDLDRVDLATVPQDLADLWLAFQQIVQNASDDGRVWWGFGRYEDQYVSFAPHIELPQFVAGVELGGRNYPELAEWLDRQEQFDVVYSGFYPKASSV